MRSNTRDLLTCPQPDSCRWGRFCSSRTSCAWSHAAGETDENIYMPSYHREGESLPARESLEGNRCQLDDFVHGLVFIALFIEDQLIAGDTEGDVETIFRAYWSTSSVIMPWRAR